MIKLTIKITGEYDDYADIITSQHHLKEVEKVIKELNDQCDYISFRIIQEEEE